MRTFVLCLLLLVGGLCHAQEEGEYTDSDDETSTTWYCDTTDCSDMYDLCDCHVNDDGEEVCVCD